MNDGGGWKLVNELSNEIVGGKNDTYLDWDEIGVNFLGQGMLNAKNLKRKEKG